MEESENSVENILKHRSDYDFFFIRSSSKIHLAYVLLNLQKAIGKANLIWTKPYFNQKDQVWSIKIEAKIPDVLIKNTFANSNKPAEADSDAHSRK